MSVLDPAGLKPHDLAKAEIDAWRGRCLNVFSRGERAVTDSLLLAHQKSPNLRLEPLAGQRLNTLEKLASEHCATEALRTAIQAAIRGWRLYDEERPFFSHGVAIELVDRLSRWHVQVDYIAVQKGVGEPRRRTWSKAEAEGFEKGLHQAFSALSGQLGQLRKRMET